jgi:hypothetical protein
MTVPTPCPIAQAEAGLLAIFAACQARQAAFVASAEVKAATEAQDRQAQADKRQAEGRFWWREER